MMTNNRISALPTAIQIMWSTERAESLGGHVGRPDVHVTYIQAYS